MSLVEVAAFRSEAEARVCVSFLHAHGVAAEIAGAHALAVMPFLSPGKGGYRVLAPEGDAATAAQLLAEIG